MTGSFSMKTPDAMHNLAHDMAAKEALEALEDEGEDKTYEELFDDSYTEILSRLDKFFRYGETLILEYDDSAQTMKVVKRR